uniref:Thioredoxin domain-containing protein n=1 Tax=Branchiostoma floridae TaxID=7739 RepID=C3YQ13_BRAFL|eukprot:XP_002601639.1 hypothetical protein BRAFLDRAFT_85783 [Branchiostoma floridae]
MDHCKTACIILLAVICVVTVATQGQELLYRHLLPRPWYYRHNFEEAVQMIPHFIMFFTPGCEQCKAMMPNFDEVADKYNTMKTPQVILAKVDCVEYDVLCKKYDVDKFPTLMMFRDGKESKVLILTKDNFHSVIRKGMTFVQFYAPWCDHCKTLLPAWDALSFKFPKRPHIQIAKMDCTAHGNNKICQDQKITDYPTLILFKSGRHIGEFGGDENFEWTVDSMHNFVATSLHVHDDL